MQKKKELNREKIERIETDLKLGLNEEDVILRKKCGLKNKTKTKGNTTYLGIVLSELFTYFNILYMLITVVLILTGNAKQLTYLFVIVPNLLIGIWQKARSKYNLDKLSLISKNKATVVRCGKEEFVDVDEIVRDDIVKFKTGSQISADSLLVQGECEVNESMLTGESRAVKKSAGDRLYAGSFLTSGSCTARVYDVGQDNYINKLTSKAKRYNKPKSEILYALNGLIKVLGIAIIPLAVLLYVRTGSEVNGVSKVAGAMIGMIPSGMFLLTSTALAVSMMRLSKHKTLVQEMYCIEMLARVDCLCMDKTGTITDGTMNVSDIFVKDEKCKKEATEIVKNMLNCVNDNELNATSKAMKEYFGTSQEKVKKDYLAFSSDRKYFAVAFESESFALGAPEFVSNIEENEYYNKIVENQMELGNRVLALAKIKTDNLNVIDKKTCEIIAVISICDHVRLDAIDTIKYFNENGVALKVISGDNPRTVSEVAKRAGIKNAEKYISLQDMSIEDVEKIANDYAVFGRVSPQQKEALIRSIKKQDHTVAFVGDGVNDILALRESDCSVSIGSGMEAAKNVSHLILVNDNFANMKQVIAEGRRCTNNLQSTGSMFLTKTFICLTLCVFSIISGFAYPFTPNQLLFLEFFAIGLPGVFFALQPNTNIIKGKFFDNVLSKAFAQGLTALIVCLPLYFLLFSPEVSRELLYTLITVIVTINSLVVLFRVTKPLNKFRLSVALSMCACVLIAFLFVTPLFGLNILAGTSLDLFSFEQLTILTGIIALIFTILAYPMQELISKIIAKVQTRCKFKSIKKR